MENNNMAIPNYQQFMDPVLQVYAEHKDRSLKVIEIIEPVADLLHLTDSNKTEMLHSGRQSIIQNRIHWACFYIFQAGLLQRPVRGKYQITEEGLKVVQEGHQIDNTFLKKYSSFMEFIQRSKTENTTSEMESPSISEEDPETRIKQVIEEMKVALEDELLSVLQTMHPKKFEQCVVILMEKMGYGVGAVTKYVNDGGIDGIIDEDALGLSKIYLQAKRYENGIKVSSSAVRNFAGALSNKTMGTHKGVFITTSDFNEGAKKEAKESSHIIKLINGRELVQLMMKHHLGVKLSSEYKVKELDKSFFDDEEGFF